ncbi:virulence protein E [Limosilactobacillus reuteri]|uniref:Virulence protein E n=1 Tax=Limosilactobacillus reuteri TaxID=1598 RepID=A0A317GHM3_LIMRT|nr:VapE domain-containing protein [Limosilactobacillus reuteri]MCH5386293.1 virulence protein E [Limosilactobacillus reuteri]PWT45989.1 virulence protein E [Limosilactobacillus reuteri]PWT50589.1 virulence protein E [Limosilactobacillus reuteri]PWT61703.1 virulence protein E [Limosilactobacillus reuteri]
MKRLSEKNDKVVPFDKKNAEKLSHLTSEEENNWGFKTNKYGQLKNNSLVNIEIILERDPILKDTFRFNEFTTEIDVVKPNSELMFKTGQLVDAYVDQIASYIENNSDYGVLFDNKKIRSAITVVAMRHHYNPIIDYFDDAYKSWDHKERLNHIMGDYLGVEETSVTELITKLFFVGAVAKVHNPKTKFDFVLDLVGGQGAGKTTFLQKIAPLGYYTDQFSTFDNKDDYAVMRRALIINDDEMTATNNASFEILKKFITLQEFEYRKPYGHQAERFDKNFVMARTTNELYYLKDKTGERRFLPLHVSKARQKHHPVTDLTDKYVKQCWGEAMQLYKDSFSFALTSEQEEKLDEHRQSFMYTDELENKIDEALNNQFRDKKFITNEALSLAVVPGIDLVKNRKIGNQISNIMVNRFGFRKKRRKINGETKRGYEKGDSE